MGHAYLSGTAAINMHTLLAVLLYSLLVACRSDATNGPALQLTQDEYMELFDCYCSRLGMESSSLGLVRDCVQDLSDLQPGLVVCTLWTCCARKGQAIELAQEFFFFRLLLTVRSVRSLLK